MDENIRKTIRGFFNVSAGSARFQTIDRRIHEGSKIDGIHMCQLIAAMLIACVGLNVDSTEAVIGAMLVCPIMGSVLAIAYGIATINRSLFKESVLGLLFQVVVCLVTSTIYFIVSPLSTQTSALLTNSSATVWDVIIAFVGGFAGAMGISRRQEPATLIAGVAVATALMPPLCSTGFGIALRDFGLAFSAFYEFLINVVFIMFGTEIVLVLLHVPLQRDLNGDGVVTEEENAEALERSHVLRKRLVIGSLVFALPCLFFSARVVRSSMEQNGTVFEVRDQYETEFTTYELKVVCPDLVAYRIGTEQSFDVEQGMIVQQVVATVQTSKELDEATRQKLEALIRLHVEDLDAVTFEVTPSLATSE